MSNTERCVYYAGGAFFGGLDFTTWPNALATAIGLGVCLALVLACRRWLATRFRAAVPQPEEPRP